MLSTFISRTKDLHFYYTVKRDLWQAGWGLGGENQLALFFIYSFWMASWVVSALLMECLCVSAPSSPLAISF